MQGSLLEQGVTLLIAGMGTVFVFLTLLVIAMTLMSAVLRRVQPIDIEVSDEEVAAISAAIRQHRRHKQ